MWCYWCQDTALYLRMKEWTPNRHVIGRRASCRRDDDAIGIRRIIVIIINPHPHLHHSGPCSACDYTVVNRQELLALAILFEHCLKHCPCINPYRIIAVKVMSEVSRHCFRRQLCQEADTPKINPDNGDIQASTEACCVDNSAIAAQHQYKVTAHQLGVTGRSFILNIDNTHLIALRLQIWCEMGRKVRCYLLAPLVEYRDSLHRNAVLPFSSEIYVINLLKF